MHVKTTVPRGLHDNYRSEDDDQKIIAEVTRNFYQLNENVHHRQTGQPP